MGKGKISEQEKAFYFYTRKRFRLFLALSLLCAVAFVAVLIVSFLLSPDTSYFYLVLVASLIPMAGMIVLGKMAVNERKTMGNIEAKARGIIR